MYMRKQKRNNRCRKQTRGYQWEEGREGMISNPTEYVNQEEM